MTVLLVEDNAYFADLVANAFKDLRLFVVPTLLAARAFLVANRVDLILLDLGLPDSQGVGTLRALSGFRVPKVVLTGSLVASEVAEMGAADYILKGTPEDIIERIRFNVNKVRRPRRACFAPEIFEQIKACLGLHAPEHFELARMS